MHEGSCLCGNVKFEITGEMSHPNACHCVECRKHSGNYGAFASPKRSDVNITGEEHLKWYESSHKARRGFCSNCGSTLFWDPLDKEKHDWTSVALGTLDGSTDVKLSQHIFVAEKGDYYEIKDGLPQNAH